MEESQRALIRKTIGRLGIQAAGGGLSGAILTGYLLGISEFCEEYDIEPEYENGVSVGAIILGPYSEPKTPKELVPRVERMIPRWKEIEKIGPGAIFDGSKFHLLFSPSMSANHDRLLWVLKEFDAQKSVESPAKLDIGVFNERTQQYQVFSNRDREIRDNPELLRDAIVASASPWPHFPSRKVGIDYYYDGAYVDLSRAASFGCDTVFNLFPYPQHYRKPNTNDPIALVTFKTRYAALIRDRDVCGSREIKLRNEYAAIISKKNERIALLQKRLTELEREIEESADGKIRLLDGVRDGVREFLGKLKKLGLKGKDSETIVNEDTTEEFISSARERELIRPLREIYFYCERPDTLTMDNFHSPVYKKGQLIREGDISIAIERGIKESRRLAEEIAKTILKNVTEGDIL